MADKILSEDNIVEIFQNATLQLHIFDFAGLYQADDKQVYAAFNERSRIDPKTNNMLYSTLDNLEKAVSHLNNLEESSKFLTARLAFNEGKKQTMNTLTQGHALIRVYAENPQHPAAIDSLKNQKEHQKHFQNALMQPSHP